MLNLETSDWIGIIGGLASLFGAYLSIVASVKAKKSSALAEEIEISITKRYDKNELILLFEEAKRVQNLFNKYISGSTDLIITGNDFKSDCNELVILLNKLNENSNIILNETNTNFSKLQRDLHQQVTVLSDNPDVKEKIKSGRAIHISIGVIIPKLKTSIRGK